MEVSFEFLPVRHTSLICAGRGAYSALINAVPSLLHSASPAPAGSSLLPPGTNLSQTRTSKPTLVTSSFTPLEQDNYPLIKYWRRSDWSDAAKPVQGVSELNGEGIQRGGSRASKGVNVACRYIEQENGDIVDGFRATAIRNIAYGIFHQLLAHGLAPKTWGAAGHDIKQHFFTEMSVQVPEMRYCEGNWKAHLLATQNYPSWSGTHGAAKSTTIKSEVIDMAVKSEARDSANSIDEDDVELLHTKRPRSEENDSGMSFTKRFRKDEKDVKVETRGEGGDSNRLVVCWFLSLSLLLTRIYIIIGCKSTVRD